MFSCSLLQASVIVEQEPDNSQETLDEVDSVKICINAAIGTTYSGIAVLQTNAI